MGVVLGHRLARLQKELAPKLAWGAWQGQSVSIYSLPWSLEVLHISKLHTVALPCLYYFL